MRIADSDEVVEHVDGVNDAATNAVAFVISQVQHGTRVACVPIHFDKLRVVVVIAG